MGAFIRGAFSAVELLDLHAEFCAYWCRQNTIQYDRRVRSK